MQKKQRKSPNDALCLQTTLNNFYCLFIAIGYCGASICVEGILTLHTYLIIQPRELFLVTLPSLQNFRTVLC
jgi:hypothetical protein